MRVISSITLAFPAQVTTTFDHNYITGQIVRLFIPLGHGMQQANGLLGIITVNGTATFLIDIDTTEFDALTNPTVGTSPQVIPVGQINSLLEASTQNVLPY